MWHWVLDGVLVAGLASCAAGWARFRSLTFDGDWIEARYAVWQDAKLKRDMLNPMARKAIEHDMRIRDVIREVDPNWDFGKLRDHVCLHHDVLTDEWWAHLRSAL